MIAFAASVALFVAGSCPAVVQRPPTLVVERITSCGGAKARHDELIRKACFVATGAGRIVIDPRTPINQWRQVILHELAHACAYAEGRDWSLGELVG